MCVCVACSLTHLVNNRHKLDQIFCVLVHWNRESVLLWHYNTLCTFSFLYKVLLSINALFWFVQLVSRPFLTCVSVPKEAHADTGKKRSPCCTYLKKFWDFIHAPVVIFAYHVVIRRCPLIMIKFILHLLFRTYFNIYLSCYCFLMCTLKTRSILTS